MTAEVTALLADPAAAFRETIRRTTMDSARSAQAAANLLGPSDIGGCRAYIAHTLAESPRDEEVGIGLAAFVGTAVGDRVEEHMPEVVPGVLTQVPLTATFPSGLQVSGNADIVTPVGVWDGKTKDGLALTRREGASFGHRAQINTYQLGAIQAGLVPPDSQWSLVYIDRSGVDEEFYVESSPYDPQITAEIEARLEDAMYAAEHDLSSAPRDEPWAWCAKVCPFFTACRGRDEHTGGGLINDEKTLSAIEAYEAAKKDKKDAEQRMKEAQARLAGVEGSTGTAHITWTYVPPSDIRAYTRASYTRLDIKPIRTKAPKAGTIGT